MDKNFTKGLLLMVIVLIIPILVEAQTNSRILNRLPIPVLVHLTKRENLLFYFMVALSSKIEIVLKN